MRKSKNKTDQTVLNVVLRVYPTKQQEKYLEKVFVDSCRWYNLCLAWFKKKSKHMSKLYDIFHQKYDKLYDSIKETKKTNEEEYNRQKELLDKEYEKEHELLISECKSKDLFVPRTKCGWKKNTKFDFTAQKAKDLFLKKHGYKPLCCFNHMNEYIEDQVVHSIDSTVKNIGCVGIKKISFKRINKDKSFCVSYCNLTHIENKTSKRQINKFFKEGFVPKLYKYSRIIIPFFKGMENLWNFRCKGDWRHFQKLFDKNGMLNEACSIKQVRVLKKSEKYYACVTISKPKGEERQLTGLECGIDLGSHKGTEFTIAENQVGFQDVSSEYEDHYITESLPHKKIKRAENAITILQQRNSQKINTWLNKEQKQERYLNYAVHKEGRWSAITAFFKDKENKKFLKSYRRIQKRISCLQQHIALLVDAKHKKIADMISKKYDFVGLEDLNVKGMIRRKKKKKTEKQNVVKKEQEKKNKKKHSKKHLSKSISRVGFGKFRRIVMEKLGKDRVIFAKRTAATSKTCACCGNKISKRQIDKLMDKSLQRKWICPFCHHKHGRDENAATNIRPSMLSKWHMVKEKE